MSFANNIEHMLLIVIPIAWLILLTIFVGICRMAARGDVPQAPPEGESAHPLTAVDGLILWEDPLEVALQDVRPRRKPKRLAGHGLPHHGVR